ncbi:MAG: hypothetical protein IIA63_12030 [Nitrospinae bacterium]|nr:hypothetical protein [Nitrospinota bacterium]
MKQERILVVDDEKIGRETIIESELLGHPAGAFTVEQAQKGLSIPKQTLYDKIKTFDLNRKDYMQNAFSNTPPFLL